MKLLSLDYDPVYGDDVDRALFRSDVSSFDYDVVIWDPAASMQTYLRRNPEYFRGSPCLTEHESVRIHADVSRRKAEFVEFVEGGRTLIIMLRPPQECNIDTGKRTYSGTGRNQVTTRHLAKFNILTASPIADFTMTPCSGTNIEFIGDGPIVSLLKKYQKRIAYRVYLPNQPGETLARVSATDRVVCSVIRIKGGGNLILLPDFDFANPSYNQTVEAEDENELDFYFQRQDENQDQDQVHDHDHDQDEDEDEDEWLPEAATFERDLLEAITSLSSAKSVTWPSWAERYLTKQQEKLRSDIVKQQTRIEAARSKLAEMERAKDSMESKNQLFLGSGRALELEVKNVLELLGGIVTEPRPGRDDWKVAFPEGKAVVEVKGVTKSAAEKHAAQLEKWVAGELEDTGEAPKGILVVNTWRDLPLDERKDDDFPSQMLPYCESRQHCILTGLQLFVIRADVEVHEDRAEYWRRVLLETSGQVDGCDDWRSVVQASKPGLVQPQPQNRT